MSGDWLEDLWWQDPVDEGPMPDWARAPREPPRLSRAQLEVLTEAAYAEGYRAGQAAAADALAVDREVVAHHRSWVNGWLVGLAGLARARVEGVLRGRSTRRGQPGLDAAYERLR